MTNNKQQTSAEIKQELKTILGDDAFSLGDMQVSKRVTTLVKAVYYMDAQLKILERWIEDEQGIKHIEEVRQSVKNILSKTREENE
jgi:hypothetical protein